MAQVSLYLDEHTLRRIETAARREHESLSTWVKKHLVTVLQTRWPERYFELFGALARESFTRPAQPSFARDARRQRL